MVTKTGSHEGPTRWSRCRLRPVLKLTICTPLYCVPLYLWSRVHLICTHVVNWHMNKSFRVTLCHKCMDTFMYISCQWHRTKTFHMPMYLEDALYLVHIIIIGDIGKHQSMLYMCLFIHWMKMETSFEVHLGLLQNSTLKKGHLDGGHLGYSWVSHMKKELD